jgi:4-amino-4-deoxy-L-arabinose transferase-like glycosyltransferase
MCASRPRPSRADTASWVALLIALCLFAVWAGLNLETFAWDGDEGMNLMRTRMWRAGYDLYSDVWSDQPPGMMVLTRLAFAVFGESIKVGRLVSIALATLGLLAVALIGREAGGWLSAFGAVGLLVTAPLFLRLSRAVMISLPALCLSTLSFALLVLYSRRTKYRWLILSGLAFGLGLLIKPLGLPVLAPIGLALVFLPVRQSRAANNTAWDVALWTIGALTPVVAALVLFDGREMLTQVVGTNTNAQSAYALTVSIKFQRIIDVLRQGHLGLTAVALYGLVVGAWHRSPIVLLLVVWLLAAALAFAVYTPIWYHHAFLVLMPLAIAAGFGLSHLLRTVQLGARARDALHRHATRNVVAGTPDMSRESLRALERPGAIEIALAAVTVIAWLAFLPGTVREIRGSVEWAQPEAWTGLVDLRELTQPGDYAITDYPVMAFRAGLLVPPQLATPSSKRIASGELIAAQLQAYAEHFQPSAVVFWSKVFRYDTPDFLTWVDDHYYPAHIYNVEQRIYIDLPESPRQAMQVGLGDRVTLLGYAAPDEIHAGERLNIVLYWQADRSMNTSYTVFSHLLDETGQLRAQADGLPVGGRHPTTDWETGETVKDLHQIEIPADLPAGRYRLQIGMYDLETLDRLAVTGQADKDAIPLRPVRVAP